MSYIERIPLSDFCPLRRSEGDDETKQELRNRAVELFYGEFLEPHEVSPAIEKEFQVGRETADEATECLHNIMRNYCHTCTIGATATGNGLIRRPPIE